MIASLTGEIFITSHNHSIIIPPATMRYEFFHGKKHLFLPIKDFYALRINVRDCNEENNLLN